MYSEVSLSNRNVGPSSALIWPTGGWAASTLPLEEAGSRCPDVVAGGRTRGELFLQSDAR